MHPLSCLRSTSVESNYKSRAKSSTLADFITGVISRALFTITFGHIQSSLNPADSVARAARGSGLCELLKELPLLLDKTYVKTRLRHSLRRRCAHLWRDTLKLPSHGRTIKTLFPCISSFKSVSAALLSSTISIKSFSLLHGHNLLYRFLFLIGKSNTASCPVCDSDVPEDSLHVLFWCPAYSGLRLEHGFPEQASFSLRRFPLSRLESFISGLLIVRKGLL